MDQRYGLAVVGYPGSVSLYQAAGADVFAVGSIDEARETLERLALPKKEESQNVQHAVIFVEDVLYDKLPADFTDRFAKRPLPAVIPVPSAQGGGTSRNRLKDLVEKAVGSDILG